MFPKIGSVRPGFGVQYRRKLSGEAAKTKKKGPHIFGTTCTERGKRRGRATVYSGNDEKGRGA